MSHDSQKKRNNDLISKCKISEYDVRWLNCVVSLDLNRSFFRLLLVLCTGATLNDESSATCLLTGMPGSLSHNEFTQRNIGSSCTTVTYR
jgi:hypothetical protein